MYNSEKFIQECLDSVIAQTYENLEVIVVDDNSTDKSADIVARYTKKQENIVCMKAKNGNASKTRRDGIKKATADLVCFVDSDDIIDKRYVERLYQAMETTQTSISACSIKSFSGNFKPKKSPSQTEVYTIDSNADSFADHYHITDTNKLTLQTLPCKLFKKDLFNDIDYSVLKTSIYEDNFIMPQILRKVKKIGVVDEVLYWYRTSLESTSNATISTAVRYKGSELNSIEFFKDVAMEYCRKMLRGSNVDAAIDRLCAAEFFNYAKMTPGLISDRKRLEVLLQNKDKQIINQDKHITDILNSKRYKIGDLALRPVAKLKKVMKRG